MELSDIYDVPNLFPRQSKYSETSGNLYFMKTKVFLLKLLEESSDRIETLTGCLYVFFTQHTNNDPHI